MGAIKSKNTIPLLATEQMQLLLHMGWEDMDYVLQRGTSLTVKEGVDSLDWGAMMNMTPDEIIKVIPEKNKNVIIVLSEEDKPDYEKLGKLVATIEPDQIGTLLLNRSDQPFFPMAPQWAERLPWRSRTITRFNRGLSSEPPEQPKWGLVSQSTKATREDGLQPDFRTVRLQTVGTELKKVELKIPAAPQDMYAIQVCTTQLAAAMDYFGKKGDQCHTIPGRAKAVSRILFVELNPEWVINVIDAWKQTPHFAIMTMAEYTGKALQGNHLVVECFTRKAVRDRLAKFLWKEMEEKLTRSGYAYNLQVVTFNKVRVGIVDPDEAHGFIRGTATELATAGILVKNERTRQFVTDEEEENTESEASETDSVGRGTDQAMIVYDTPPWLEQEAIMEMLGGVPGVEVRQAYRMVWTPGSPMLAAWRVHGDGLDALGGAVLISEGEEAMRVMTVREFSAARREQQESRSRRTARNYSQSGGAGGAAVAPRRSYAQAAQTPTPRRITYVDTGRGGAGNGQGGAQFGRGGRGGGRGTWQAQP